MNCPHCQIAYDPEHWETCPHCGKGDRGAAQNQPEMLEVQGVLRTSTILIAEGEDARKTYRSLEEVPEPLRRRLVESTSGLNSGVIYIADQRGREQITRALRDLPKSASASAVTGAPAAAFHSTVAYTPPSQPAPRFRTRASLSLFWFPLLLLASAGAVIWLVGSRGW